MINIQKAKESFEEYVKDYNINDEKIKLKVEHTFRVGDVSKFIAENIGLNDENIKLAMLIGLLHDIGRFEQIRIYDTFFDLKSIDHADFGIKLLFEDNLIRKFIEDDKYDNIIKQAISNHNKYEICDGLSEQELLHSKIIRDADKMDIFYIIQDMNFELEYKGGDLSYDSVSDDILNSFVNHKHIMNINVKTNLDDWIKHLAWIYDFNFDCSLKYIKEKNYINKLIDRIEYKNEDTIKKMNIIRKVADDFLNSVD